MDELIESLKLVDSLKTELDKFRNLDNYKIQAALDIEYTYESNRIEGNTLTLNETQIVVEKGLTISGKTLKEHLEAINHIEAIGFIKEIVQNEIPINEYVLRQIHGIILKSIDKDNAGMYRKVPVMISGSKHIPPQHYLVPQLMEDFFHYYDKNQTLIHPVILAAEIHEKLVTIHPFIDGNGRTSRLLMNIILLKNGYPIANIKGDYESRLKYYSALEKAQTMDDRSDFIDLVISEVKNSLVRMISILK